MGSMVVWHTSLVWLLPEWLGYCSPGLPWTWWTGGGESILQKQTLPTSLSSRSVGHSVFHWYNHLATIFDPSISLKDIIAHIGALTTFTQQALIDSQQSSVFTEH